MVLPDDTAMGDGELWTVMVKTMYFQRVMRMKLSLYVIPKHDV